MRRTRRMLANFSVINVILAGVFVLLLGYAVFPMFHKTVKIRVPVAKKQPAAVSAAPKQEEGKTPSQADYVVIAEQNLFRPDRKIPVDKKDAAPLPKPEFVLYGTLLTDDLHLAYMEDRKAPQNSPSRGKKQIPVKLGESLSGYTLKKIDTDKVVMARGEEEIDVHLNDATMPKDRRTGPSAPAPQQAAAPGARPPLPAGPAAGQPAFISRTPPPAPAQPVPAARSVGTPTRGGRYNLFRR